VLPGGANVLPGKRRILSDMYVLQPTGYGFLNCILLPHCCRRACCHESLHRVKERGLGLAVVVIGSGAAVIRGTDLASG
jgi:hypothetical protein